MATLMSLLLAVSGVISLVCWVMVLIKIFRENIGLGILGVFCGLFAFVYGWVKVKEYDCQNVMLVWSIATAVSIIANALGAGQMFNQFMAIEAAG